MTKRALFSKADLIRAASVARDTGVSVVITTPDGAEYRFDPTPPPAPPADPFDLVDMKA